MDGAISEVSMNRFQEFNDIIYAFEPVDKQMKGIRQFVDELSSSAKTIRKELEGQNSDLLHLHEEESPAYYNYVIGALQTFEKIERHMEAITFLVEERNYLAAIEELQMLDD